MSGGDRHEEAARAAEAAARKAEQVAARQRAAIAKDTAINTAKRRASEDAARLDKQSRRQRTLDGEADAARQKVAELMDAVHDRYDTLVRRDATLRDHLLRWGGIALEDRFHVVFDEVPPSWARAALADQIRGGMNQEPDFKAWSNRPGPYRLDGTWSRADATWMANELRKSLHGLRVRPLRAGPVASLPLPKLCALVGRRLRGEDPVVPEPVVPEPVAPEPVAPEPAVPEPAAPRNEAPKPVAAPHPHRDELIRLAAKIPKAGNLRGGKDLRSVPAVASLLEELDVDGTDTVLATFHGHARSWVITDRALYLSGQSVPLAALRRANVSKGAAGAQIGDHVLFCTAYKKRVVRLLQVVAQG